MNKLNLRLINDIDPERKEAFLNTIHDHTQFSISYISLLVVSTIISTLGLLINSPATIIGGMIISPLMWPLVKISTGISLARKSYLLETLYLLFGSLALIVITASMITLISPLKGLNAEILTRSQPTLLDLIIALAAGAIAAMALIHKRISSSLAGVAIATSLLPPLCVTGIGLALTNFSIASGSFLLFAANAVSIIFISIFVFQFAGITNHSHEEFRKESILFVAIMLAITALPLFIFLREYSFKTQVFQKTEQVLEETFNEVSPEIVINNISTKVSNQKNNIQISADILVPEGITLSIEQKEQIIAQLEKILDRTVQLNLLVQQTIALESETDLITEERRNKLRDSLIGMIGSISESLAIDAINISYNQEKASWDIHTVMRADPSIVLTEEQRKELQSMLSAQIEQPVSLAIEIIPRIQLQEGQNAVYQSIEQDISAYLTALNEDIETVSFSMNEEQSQTVINLEIQSPQSFTLTRPQMNTLISQLENTYDTTIELHISDIKRDIYTF